MNAIGRVFRAEQDDPFRGGRCAPCGDRRARAQSPDPRLARGTTSEKLAMGWHLDGRFSAVLGTHTHVPPLMREPPSEGTALLRAAWSTARLGPGVEPSIIVARYLDHLPRRFEVASGSCSSTRVVLDIADENGRARFHRAVDREWRHNGGIRDRPHTHRCARRRALTGRPRQAAAARGVKIQALSDHDTLRAWPRHG